MLTQYFCPQWKCNHSIPHNRCTVYYPTKQKRQKKQKDETLATYLTLSSYERLCSPPCTETIQPPVLSGLQPASLLKDGLKDAFVSASYLSPLEGNNSNVWLKENRANHQ